MKFEVYGKDKINVIFLHGWGASKSNFVWIKDYVSATCHFASLDGFDDEPPPEDITIEGYAKKLKHYIQKNNIENVILVGHSFGGRIAIEYASKNTLLGLVLVDSAGIKPKFSFSKFFKIAKYKIVKILCKVGLINKRCLQKYGSTDYKNANAQMKKVLSCAVKYNQKKQLEKIECKTLIYWGEKDKDTPIYMAKIMKRKIKNSQLVLTSGGHFSFLEDKYKFYTVLDFFIKSL